MAMDRALRTLCILVAWLGLFYSGWLFMENRPTLGGRALALPWYTTWHPPFNDTERLTDDARQAWHEQSVALAEAEAQRMTTAISVIGIPGSQIKTQDEAAQLRRLLDCWTGRGRWVQGNPRVQLRHVQDPWYSKCDRKSKGMPRKATHYVWETPAECPRPVTMDPHQWCALLRGRNILLVGDLVHYQLHDLFLDAIRDGPTVCYGEMNCKDHTLCSSPDHGESAIRYLRNDVLSTRSRILDSSSPSTDVITWPFMAHHILPKYPILILNRAPVLESDEVFARELAHTLQAIRRARPNALILYRATSVGHPYCDEAHEPLKGPLTDAMRRELPYGWSEQARRNAMARPIVEAAGGLFIDLATPTDLRPDGHVGGQDCLRYCFPGPLDTWLDLLFHAFLGLEKSLPRL